MKWIAPLLIALAAPNETRHDTPGWYHVELANGQRLTVKILQFTGGICSGQYQGNVLRLDTDRTRSIEPIDGIHPDLSAERESACRDAIERFETADPKEIDDAAAVLRASFPACRPLLHEALGDRRVSVRRETAKLLGALGSRPEDGAPLAACLRDPDRTVRLVAIFSLRSLGAGDPRPIADFLAREPEANLRKAAVKTLERWRNPAVVPTLVQSMQSERDHGVRAFYAQALRYYLKQDLGDDPAAWRDYYETIVADRNAKGEAGGTTASDVIPGTTIKEPR